MRIIYIEDNPNDAQLVARYFRTTPHTCEIVATVAEAQQALAEPFDLLLVDIILNNNRSSLSFVKELRSQGVSKPIIAVTAVSTPDNLRKCDEAGFNEVLLKPFEITKLAHLVSKFT